ncbi:factor associated with metabolism and energy isoform X2 [Notamacropus eugenii]|uniref:factor associated with metabolism and energy isoform X2 n=1 Tax=Notamacropus eugenii TaxID=9315 RepID=UPI003B670BC5
MGSKHSKTHPRVTRVAPMQDKDSMCSPASPVDLVFNDNSEDQSLYSFARLQEKKKTLDRQLPPLRETLYGRYSSGAEVPRPMSVDIPLEKGETSIIKRHPPRRFQVLGPLEPQVLIAEKFLTLKEAETTRKKKELEKRMQALTYSSGKRQYLHKMKMLEMNCKKQEAQAELKRSLHREARINKHKMRELKAKNILENMPSNDGSEDFVATEPHIPMNGETGNARNREFVKYNEWSEHHSKKNGELRRWSLKQQVQDELFWDSSSSNSDESGKEERKSWTLVRTKTERIPLFDEFFDQE